MIVRADNLVRLYPALHDVECFDIWLTWVSDLHALRMFYEV